METAAERKIEDNIASMERDLKKMLVAIAVMSVASSALMLVVLEAVAGAKNFGYAKRTDMPFWFPIATAALALGINRAGWVIPSMLVAVAPF